ncbi:MAG: hypothetical protein JXA73_01655 [Acidobacteria bacterium]|nr:hypothetical protein [Acidobacteriota bacterium]
MEIYRTRVKITYLKVTMKTIASGFFVSLFLITPAAIHAQDQTRTPQLKSTAEIMTQPMNVFRRFSGDARIPLWTFSIINSG